MLVSSFQDRKGTAARRSFAFLRINNFVLVTALLRQQQIDGNNNDDIVLSSKPGPRPSTLGRLLNFRYYHSEMDIMGSKIFLVEGRFHVGINISLRAVP